jgi:hypothetical protein
MIDTVPTQPAATEMNDQHVNGAESELQIHMDHAAIAILKMKGMMSFNYFVEQFQMPVEFLISNVCLFHL